MTFHRKIPGFFGIFFTDVGVEFEQKIKNKNKNMFEVEVSEVIFSQHNSLEVRD